MVLLRRFRSRTEFSHEMRLYIPNKRLAKESFFRLRESGSLSENDLEQ